MCGIAGFVAPRGEHAGRRVLERMIATLRHRGPDALGYHLEGRVGLGVARLRVIDLETGDQPMANEDGSVHAVLNGEIYNFLDLRADLAGRGHRFATRSDTEVIVHSWEEYGEHCLDAFNGMFAFALWDRRREQLILARDRMGEKPLYYALVDGWLVFGSELRALLAHPAVGRELDLRSVSRYLAYEYVPAPHSIVRDIKKLPPAHTLTVSEGKVSLQSYWDIPFRPDPAVDETSWCREIAWRLDEAVRLRLRSDVPLGCFLSGGIDSTAVAVTAAQHTGGRIRTFSVGYAEPAYDERRFARIVAERWGTQHEELVVSATDAGALLPQLGALLDEPIADMSFVPLYLLSRAARGSVTVALTGDGGDELFAGYLTMAAEWWHDAFARLPRAVRRGLRSLAEMASAPEPLRDFLRTLEYRREARNQALLGGLPPERQALLLSPAVRAELVGVDAYEDIDEALGGCPSRDPTDRLIYWYCKLYLAGENLANADRASMAVGLELRAPFLDHTFVEFMGRIPSRLKLQGFHRLKRLLKRALADRLPPEIVARRKQGFRAPLGEWFRGPLASLLHDALAPARLRAGGIFNVDVVQRLIDEHLRGARDHRKVLWALFVLELWRTHHLGDGR